jgi:hypothetical protein
VSSLWLRINFDRIVPTVSNGFVLFTCLMALLMLGACNSSSLYDGLRPSASVGNNTGRQAAPESNAAAGSNETALAPRQNNPAATPFNSRSAALPQVPPVAFLPVTGAPQSKVTELAASMRAAARDQQVPVVVSADDGAQYQVKGYFSALSDGGGSLLVYVWDILDRNGTRVHRISGEERGGSTRGDPWSAISEEMIDRLARSTMSDLRNWMTRAGTG